MKMILMAAFAAALLLVGCAQTDAAIHEIVTLGAYDPEAAPLQAERALTIRGESIHSHPKEFARELARIEAAQELKHARALGSILFVVSAAGLFGIIIRDKKRKTEAQRG